MNTRALLVPLGILAMALVMLVSKTVQEVILPAVPPYVIVVDTIVVVLIGSALIWLCVVAFREMHS